MKKTYIQPTVCITLAMQEVIMASATENFGQYKTTWY